MDFDTCFKKNKLMLMEGALGERLKREYHLEPDEDVALAGLVYEQEGRLALLQLWRGYQNIAEKYQLPFVATTPTRRANKERVANSKFSKAIIRDNVMLLRKVQQEAEVPMYIGGLMGCKGDAYKADEVLEEDEAEEFHSWQAQLFKEAEADFLYAGIMPAVREAIGMARAMTGTGLPYIISFMIRKDGRLIDGTSIHEAIVRIDESVSYKPLCYMTNCVHPVIVSQALDQRFNKTSIVKTRFLRYSG